MNIEKTNTKMVLQLSQDPHRTQEGECQKVLEVAIDREVRGYRRQPKIIATELSGLTGISVGMLWKIENGNTSSSRSS